MNAYIGKQVVRKVERLERPQGRHILRELLEAVAVQVELVIES